MKVIKTAEGFELIPHTKDELERLRWLIECLRSHPNQRVVEVNGAGGKWADPQIVHETVGSLP